MDEHKISGEIKILKDKEKKKKITRKDLKDRWWYRLLKVFYILIIIFVVIIIVTHDYGVFNLKEFILPNENLVHCHNNKSFKLSSIGINVSSKFYINNNYDFKRSLYFYCNHDLNKNDVITDLEISKEVEEEYEESKESALDYYQRKINKAILYIEDGYDVQAYESNYVVKNKLKKVEKIVDDYYKNDLYIEYKYDYFKFFKYNIFLRIGLILIFLICLDLVRRIFFYILIGKFFKLKYR